MKNIVSSHDDAHELSPDRESGATIDASPAAEIGRLVGEKKFCAAARLYSETTGADLIESKLAIDRLASRHGLAPNNGCASYFALLVGLGGAGAWGLSQWLSALL